MLPNTPAAFDELPPTDTTQLPPSMEEASPEEQQQAALQARYGTFSQQLATGLEGAAEGLSFGVSPAVEQGLGVPREDILGREAANPWTHTGAVVGGSLLPLLAGDPAQALDQIGVRSVAGIAEHLPPNLLARGARAVGNATADALATPEALAQAEKLGTNIEGLTRLSRASRTAEDATRLGIPPELIAGNIAPPLTGIARFAPGAVRAGIEGLGYGAGQVVKEESLGEDPSLTAIALTVGGSGLLGSTLGTVGEAIGLGASNAGRAFRKNAVAPWLRDAEEATYASRIGLKKPLEPGTLSAMARVGLFTDGTAPQAMIRRAEQMASGIASEREQLLGQVGTVSIPEKAWNQFISEAEDVQLPEGVIQGIRETTDRSLPSALRLSNELAQVNPEAGPLLNRKIGEALSESSAPTRYSRAWADMDYRADLAKQAADVATTTIEHGATKQAQAIAPGLSYLLFGMGHLKGGVSLFVARQFAKRWGMQATGATLRTIRAALGDTVPGIADRLGGVAAPELSPIAATGASTFETPPPAGVMPPPPVAPPAAQTWEQAQQQARAHVDALTQARGGLPFSHATNIAEGVPASRAVEMADANAPPRLPPPHPATLDAAYSLAQSRDASARSQLGELAEKDRAQGRPHWRDDPNVVDPAAREAEVRAQREAQEAAVEADLRRATEDIRPAGPAASATTPDETPGLTEEDRQRVIAGLPESSSARIQAEAASRASRIHAGPDDWSAPTLPASKLPPKPLVRPPPVEIKKSRLAKFTPDDQKLFTPQPLEWGAPPLEPAPGGPQRWRDVGQPDVPRDPSTAPALSHLDVEYNRFAGELLNKQRALSGADTNLPEPTPPESELDFRMRSMPPSPQLKQQIAQLVAREPAADNPLSPIMNGELSAKIAVAKKIDAFNDRATDAVKHIVGDGPPLKPEVKIDRSPAFLREQIAKIQGLSRLPQVATTRAANAAGDILETMPNTDMAVQQTLSATTGKLAEAAPQPIATGGFMDPPPPIADSAMRDFALQLDIAHDPLAHLARYPDQVIKMYPALRATIQRIAFDHLDGKPPKSYAARQTLAIISGQPEESPDTLIQNQTLTADQAQHSGVSGQRRAARHGKPFGVSKMGARAKL